MKTLTIVLAAYGAFCLVGQVGILLAITITKWRGRPPFGLRDDDKPFAGVESPRRDG